MALVRHLRLWYNIGQNHIYGEAYPYKKEGSMKKNKRKKGGLGIVLLAILALFIGYLIWENSGFAITHYTYQTRSVPDELDGMKILLITDLHNKEFGENNETLLSAIREGAPDLIAITGDLISRNDTDLSPAVNLAKACTEIAPVYYVTGNHERQSALGEQLIAQLEEAGVTVLMDEAATFTYGEGKISLWGISDDLQQYEREYPDAGQLSFTLSRLRLEGNQSFRILLAHEPQYFSTYAKSGVDLVLSGHTHGGQFRIPLIGAVYCPDQGFFAKYQSGIYKEGDTTMYLSRGLGSSTIPFRAFCRGELVFITLKAK
jgi:predicted MPP superfamily phosphohydrolase